ncbi:MLX-interacting protein isoform X1 [Amia ocellicauda]|uniref:MLX-interacting protein isoform X1 n=1 Tax=Amia ocellicauda TaxID=2972642 RepID=UPI0034644D75
MATMELRPCRRAPVIKPEHDDDSDAEEPNLGLKKSDGQEPQIIHSGHFMVSSPHSEHPPKKGYDFDTVNKQTCHTYCFGKTSTSHLSIDASLTKLFECMTLAYSGRLVSPKWKNFKGLKLLWRDKIRLNNAIWRAWYMQYVEKRDNPVCHFVTPLDGSVDSEEHRRPEAIATEGKYWKRRIEIVIREYHKWRTYFKKRLQKHKDEDLSSLLKGAGEQFSLFGECCPDTFRVSLCQDEEVGVRRASWKSQDSPVPMEMDQLFDMDMLMSEFSDTLFSTIASHQAVAWPNPREIAHAGNADMIQPGLIPLQPNLDFMDTFEPFQDLFHIVRQPALSLPSLSNSNSPTQASILQPVSLSPDLPSVSLDHEFISSPGTTSIVTATPNHSSESSTAPDSTFGHNFLPLYSVPVSAGDTSASDPPRTSLHPTAQKTSVPHPGLAPSSQATAPTTVQTPKFESVITHTASSTVTHSAAATTFGQSPGFTLQAVQHTRVPLKTALQPRVRQPLPPTAARQTPQTFALPKPINPSSSGKRTKHLQKIVPAGPKPLAFFTPGNRSPDPFWFGAVPIPGQTSAVIVTPGPMKGEGVPTTGVVITPTAIGRSTGLPEFHILQQAQNSPQLIIPKEETTPSTACRKQASSPTAVRDGRSSGKASPCASEQSTSPQSPLNTSTGLSKLDTPIGMKIRRGNHISAEQKRRFNIKIGFETLSSLVSTLKSQSNAKPISNAATLQKTVEYIAKLQQERLQMQEEARRLREEIEELNASINTCQEQLPATGVPITRHRFDHMRDLFDEYVKNRTLQNWKFWIFSIIIKPLFESFNAMVSTTSTEELCQTTLSWLDQHCSLPVLRPMVLRTLRQLSTTTSILSDPSHLPEQATQAVTQGNTQTGES